MSVDVTPAPIDAVPPEAYVSKLYSPEDIAAMVEMLEEEPVLLGNDSLPTERQARHRAGTVRGLLADHDVHVKTRTWPDYDDAGVLRWKWCVIRGQEVAANGRSTTL